ncbi:MAG: ABC transporter permease [Desulfofustis sp.]|jgi:ABC-2 type transport system permease protein|nr:ABC transporter permease [Desulfofustis sp.]
MSLRQLLTDEIRSIFSDTTVMLTVFLGVFLYSFLYPLPYLKQLPREQQAVVVNLDGSQLSRQLERMVDATPQIRISERVPSLGAARERLLSRTAAGILVIPEHFYRDLRLGLRPTLGIAGDASMLLVYGTVLEGMSTAAGTLAAQVAVQQLMVDGQPPRLAQEQFRGAWLNLRTVFNPTMGYVSYVIPAVFVLILHQTLVIGIGLLSCARRETVSRSPGAVVLVRCGLFLAVYLLLCLYYFGFCYDLYGIPRQAELWTLAAIMVPFLAAASFLGMTLGLVLPRRELVTLVVLLSSMPLIFSSGFIWPESALPRPLVLVLQLIPVQPAIKALLSANQMGAGYAAVVPQLVQLWLCAGFYGALAWYLAGKRLSVRLS